LQARYQRLPISPARNSAHMEMPDHVFLTPDRDVQQTVFADGTRVTVNFGDTPHRLNDGTVVKPMAFSVSP